jgi:hypothetical protein
MKIKKGIMASD